jgi:hypothetical protein
MRGVWMAIGLLALTVSTPISIPVSAGGLGEAGELEHARANARAGGPISERDAELLERYGCLSGTDNDFCRKLENRSSSKPPRKTYKKKKN